MMELPKYLVLGIWSFRKPWTFCPDVRRSFNVAYFTQLGEFRVPTQALSALFETSSLTLQKRQRRLGKKSETETFPATIRLRSEQGTAKEDKVGAATLYHWPCDWDDWDGIGIDWDVPVGTALGRIGTRLGRIGTKRGVAAESRVIAVIAVIGCKHLTVRVTRNHTYLDWGTKQRI
jgi:hypothetical protein